MMRKIFELLGPTRTVVVVTLIAVAGIDLITCLGLRFAGLTITSAHVLVATFATLAVVPAIALPLVRQLFRTFKLESENYRKATFDQLTNLMSRGAFITAADSYLNLARRRQSPFAIAFLDIDNFKQINDRLGHSMGDYILKELGKALNGVRRKSDVVGRYGGDEFVVLLPETDLTGAEHFADKVHSAVRNVSNVDDTELNLSVSIGVTTRRFDNQYMTLEALIDQSDQALYSAKQAGKSRTVFYVKKSPKTEPKRDTRAMQIPAGQKDAVF
jgi:diguanylate cyclase (GGDEF)-like protein